MSEKQNFTAVMTVDASQMKSELKDSTNSVKVINKEFEASVVGLGKWSDSQEGLAAKIKQTTKIEEEQNKQLEIHKKLLESSTKEIESQKQQITKLTKEKERSVKLTGIESKETKALNKEIEKSTKSLLRAEKSQKTLNHTVKITELEIKKTRGETERLNKELDNLGKGSGKGLKNVAKEIEGVGKSADSSNKKVGALSVAMGTLMAKAAVAAGKAALKAGKEFAKMGNEFLDYSDNVLKASKDMDISTDVVQSWGHAMKTVGIEQASGEAALKKSLDGIKQARKGTGEAFRLYSSTVKGFQKMDDKDVLNNLMKTLADIPDEAKRSAKAVQFFGDSAGDMMKLLDKGSSGFDKSINALGNAGGIIGEDSLKAAKKAKTAMSDLQIEISAMMQVARIKIGEALLPVMEAISKFFSENKEKIASMIGELVGAIGDLIVGLLPIFISIGESLIELLPVILDIAKVLGPILGVAFEVLAKHGDVLIPIILGLVTAFKVYNVILPIYTALQTGAAAALWAFLWPVLAVVAAVVAIIAVFKNWDKIMKVVNDAVVNMMKYIGKLFEFIGELGKKFVELVKEYLPKVIEGFLSFIKFIQVDLPLMLLKGFANAMAEVLKFFADMLSKAISGIAEVGGAIVKGISSLPGKMAQMGKDIVIGLWNGIKSMGSWISSNVTGFFSGVLGGIGKVFGWNSPAKQLIALGEDIDRGLVIGVDKESKRSKSKIGKVFDRMLGTMDGKKKIDLGFAASGGVSKNTKGGPSNSGVNNNEDNSTEYTINNTFNVKGELPAAEVARRQRSILEGKKRR